MAISNINPAANATIQSGDSVSFDIDDTYTSITIEVEVDGGAIEFAYDSTLGGAQAGYTVSVSVPAGGTHRFTLSRDAGFNTSPFAIKVVENETGSSATTSYSYLLATLTKFSDGTQPYFRSLSEDDVQGPLSSTDNALVRWDGTSGALQQDSLVTVDDTGRFNGGLAINVAADHPQTPAAGFGQVWPRSSDGHLIYTDPTGTDTDLISVGGGGGGLSGYGSYLYDTTTSGAGIPSGDIRFNNATITSATECYISKTNNQSVNLGASLDELDGWKLSWVKGDGTVYGLALCGTPVDNSTYFTVPISAVIGATTITDNDELVLSPIPSAAFPGTVAEKHYIYYPFTVAGNTANQYSGQLSRTHLATGSMSTNRGAVQGSPTAPGSIQILWTAPWAGKVTNIQGWYEVTISGFIDTHLECWKWARTDGSSVQTGTEVGFTGGFHHINLPVGGGNWKRIDVDFTTGNTFSQGDALEILTYDIKAMNGYPRISLTIEVEKT